MLRISRSQLTSPITARVAFVASAAVVSTLMAGCSADVSRFDLSSGVGSPERSSTASIPTPSEPLRRNAGIPVDDNDATALPRGATYDRTPPGGYNSGPGAGTAREPTMRTAGLPEPGAREPVQRPMSLTQRAPAAPAASRPITATAPTAATQSPAQTIEVQQGDTLYGISKRYRVSVSELMALNQLQSPAIKPGQKLTLPGGKRAVAQRNLLTAQRTTPQQTATSAMPAGPAHATAPTRAAAANWNGSYTVVAGDSLFGIARKHGVKTADLQAINGITEPTKVRPGTALKVPGDGSAPAVATERRSAPLFAASLPTTSQQATGARPNIINAAPGAETRVAALGSSPTVNDAEQIKPETAALAEPPKTSSATKFRWPAKGKVIASFGPRMDSTHNDGINISVPKGTDILAAENGVVAYAGNELKGYGNLILVRHEGNWVSAYAHADQIMVKRGDKVKRGQPIAKAGATGTVDQPQVHFELRQGSKPIDPLPHMERQ